MASRIAAGYQNMILAKTAFTQLAVNMVTALHVRRSFSELLKEPLLELGDIASPFPKIG
ncbi:MAG: hypothetical protein L0H63_10750 [Nitrococcus sp.]|nr:hypothetical protein [Nitrococcus sp.]